MCCGSFWGFLLGKILPGERNRVLNVVENNNDDNELYAAMLCPQSSALRGENLFKSDG